MSSFIQSIFKAASAKKGGMVRRSRASVRRYASYAQLKAAVKKRGFHLLRNGDQYIILCNRGACRLIA
jgi:hypothetical protein